MTAWMFPGQGSQQPRMAVGVAACGGLIDHADAALGVDLRPLCLSDEQSDYGTPLLQPAIFVTSMGVAAPLSDGPGPDAVIGHSLGDYAALVIAGSLTFVDALRLVTARAEAMHEAADRAPGGMVAVLGLDARRVEEVCDPIDGVWVANVNAPKQTIISGTENGLAEAATQCRSAGAFRVKRLNVPIACHTPLMNTAAETLRPLVQQTPLSSPKCAFYSAVDGNSHDAPEEIGRLLVEGISAPVHFERALKQMSSDGIRSFVEVGPGRVLSGLAKYSVPNASIASVSNDVEVREHLELSSQPSAEATSSVE